MPRDINDVYTLPAGNPVIPGTVIDDEWANNTLNDIAQALTDSLDKSDPAEARNILLLGTSATKNVQTSVTDQDLAKVALVGMFGFGGPAQVISAPGSLNSLFSTDITRVVKVASANALSVGAPIAADTTILHVSYSATHSAQIAMPVTGSENYYVRRCVAGVWSTWTAVVRESVAGILSRTAANLQVTGIVDGSDAAAGIVGEVLQAVRSTGLGLSISTAANVTSLTLTPGDWDVVGNVRFTGTATNTSIHIGGISETSATVEAEYSHSMVTGGVNTSVFNQNFSVPARRFNVTANKTIYLVGFCTFSGGTQQVLGILRARRAR